MGMVVVICAEQIQCSTKKGTFLLLF